MIDKIMMKMLYIGRKYSLCADMFLSFAATFAAAAFTYEKYMPKRFMDIVCPAAVLACFMTWVCLAFLSGVYNKYGYAAFTVLFWLVPQIVIYLADEGPKFLRMSIIMYLFSEFSSFLTLSPAERVGKFIGIGALPAVFIIVLSCALFFLAGILFSDGKKWKKLGNSYR